MNSIYEIENSLKYLSWRQARDEAGGVGRTLLIAEEVNGTLHYGVQLSDGERYLEPVPGAMLELIEAKAAKGFVGPKRGKDLWDSFKSQHPGPYRVEVCCSHVGGFIRICADQGAVVHIDEW